MSQVFPIMMLREIPFSLVSMVEMCTKPGSYERAIAKRVVASVELDILDVINALINDGKQHDWVAPKKD